ncbi:alpha/beta hydrolase [Blastomonas sp.]|uniref:alpha/beta hydrolase n=1 Tax=Blastomonas sp. TaxID=1909299 RepID=UPI002637D036|nr:alpha/beta hydrolase [Blastomonas sp.]MDM7957304.1 alpha/beta hydrolase [Blastomonas sp.]
MNHNTSFLDRADRPRLVYHHRRAVTAAAVTPTLVFLPGYASDMTGTKALALDGWAERQGLAMLRFDYAGCGASGGKFDDQGLADWRDDVLALIDTVVSGPVLLIGSSMGGWLALLVALARPARVAGIVGIAAAPDFTMWGFSQEEKMTILTEGRLEKPSEYGPEPMVTTRKFWQSGEGNRVLIGEIAIDCPVRLIQGQADADVPWQYALETQKQLRAQDVQLLLIKDGDHRLSRDQDIALLLQTVGDLVERVAA